MVAVLAEILNFTTMLTLLSEDASETLPWAEMTVEQKTFKIWIIIEVLIFIMTVISNVLYVFFRACCGKSVSIEIPSEHEDNCQDFLHASSTRILIDVFTTFVAPLLIFFFFGLGYFATEGITDAEKEILFVQCIM